MNSYSTIAFALGAAAYFAVGQSDPRDGSLYSHRVSAVSLMLRLFVLATFLMGVLAIQENEELRLQQLLPLLAVMSLIALREFWSRVSFDPNQKPWEGSLALKVMAAGSMAPVLIGLAYLALILALPSLANDLSTLDAALYTAVALGIGLLIAQGLAHVGLFDAARSDSLRTRRYQMAMLKLSERSAATGEWTSISLRPRTADGYQLTAFSAAVWSCEGTLYWSNEQLAHFARYFNWARGELELPSELLHRHVATVHLRPKCPKLRVLQFSKSGSVLAAPLAHLRFRRDTLNRELSTRGTPLDEVERSTRLNRVDLDLLQQMGFELLRDATDDPADLSEPTVDAAADIRLGVLLRNWIRSRFSATH